MLKDSGIPIGGGAMQEILQYNAEVGPKTLYTDNYSAKEVLANTAQQAANKGWGFVRGLGDRLTWATHHIYRGGNDTDFLANARMKKPPQSPNLLLGEGYRTDRKPADSEWQ